MATIYRIALAPNRSVASERPTASAEIILFPGVRYERWSETQQTTRTAQRNGKPRDRLEISE